MILLKRAYDPPDGRDTVIECWSNDSDNGAVVLPGEIQPDGALSRKLKQLIAVAVAHTTQCPYCIRSHTQGALRDGATEREIMEAIWVAAEMRAGAAFAHSVIALEAMAEATRR